MFIMLFSIEQDILAKETLAIYGNSPNPLIFPPSIVFLYTVFDYSSVQ